MSALSESEDIRSLNLHALLLFRDILKTDLQKACYKFGCPLDIGRQILEMGFDDLQRFAVSANLIFSLKINPTTVTPMRVVDPSLHSALVEVQHATL